MSAGESAAATGGRACGWFVTAVEDRSRFSDASDFGGSEERRTTEDEWTERPRHVSVSQRESEVVHIYSFPSGALINRVLTLFVDVAPTRKK